MGVAVGLTVYVLLTWAYLSAASGFEITKRMEKDQILVEMCMKYNLNNTICGMLYGEIPESSKGNPGNSSGNYSIFNGGNTSIGY